MRLNKDQPYYHLILISYLIISSLFIYLLIANSINYTNSTNEYTELLNFKDRLFNYKEWLSFLYSDTNSEKLNKANILIEKANEYYWNLLVYSVLVVLISIIFAYLGRKEKYLTITLIASVFYILGVTIPFIELGAYDKDIVFDPLSESSEQIGFLSKIGIKKTFEGKTYYYYQSKSVIGVIWSLFLNKNIVVGFLLLLFSLGIPIAKILYSFLSALSLENDKYRPKWIKVIGRWSMADVFIASCFVSFLSFNNMKTGITTQSDILVGFYFFLLYVLLSLYMSNKVKN